MEPIFWNCVKAAKLLSLVGSSCGTKLPPIKVKLPDIIFDLLVLEASGALSYKTALEKGKRGDTTRFIVGEVEFYKEPSFLIPQIEP